MVKYLSNLRKLSVKLVYFSTTHCCAEENEEAKRNFEKKKDSDQHPSDYIVRLTITLKVLYLQL